MGQREEPKLDELKKLLRRLDGLDGDKSLTKTGQQAEAEQRGWVGALRGMPAVVPDEPRTTGTRASREGSPNRNPAIPVSDAPSRSIGPTIFAAATAAVVSTVAVFMIMSWQANRAERGANSPPAGTKQSPPSGTAKQQSNDTPDGLVRRADQLLDSGEIEAGRTLLQRAAELGSGSAALKLARTYDPTQSGPLIFADSQSNPALAKAWYERALALGTREAAAYLTPPDGK